MSALKKTTRDASTCRKLAPPRSLRGEEDAEVTWDVIVKRYPNAAPLLIEMEDVIERAEDLLRQLRSPYTHALERSSSFQIADSEDEAQILGSGNVAESTEVSTISEQDSRLFDSAAETAEIPYASKIPVLESRDNPIQDRLNRPPDGETLSFRDVETVERSDSEEADVANTESNDSSILESPAPGFAVIYSTTDDLDGSQKSLQVEKTRSLAAWAAVVEEKATANTNSEQGAKTAPSGYKEDSVSEHAWRPTSLKSGPAQQIAKLNFPGKKEEVMQRFAGTIATASKLDGCTARLPTEQSLETVHDNVHVRAKVEDAAAASGPARMPKGVETVVPIANGSGGERCDRKEGLREGSLPVHRQPSDEPIANVTTKLDDQAQGNGDEALGTKPRASEPRSPIEILDEYSKICDLKVEYKTHGSSCSYNRSVIVRCSMGGFAFEACAQSRKTAKTAATAKLVRCLAGRQIDGENTANLTPFTRKQIEEIIRLGNGGEHETAVRKLYKICVEENAPEPVYHMIEQSTSIHGNRYSVKCEALSHTTSGFGIRINIAKRVAADQILHIYHKTRSPVVY